MRCTINFSIEKLQILLKLEFFYYRFFFRWANEVKSTDSYQIDRKYFGKEQICMSKVIFLFRKKKLRSIASSSAAKHKISNIFIHTMLCYAVEIYYNVIPIFFLLSSLFLCLQYLIVKWYAAFD